MLMFVRLYETARSYHDHALFWDMDERTPSLYGLSSCVDKCIDNGKDTYRVNTIKHWQCLQQAMVSPLYIVLFVALTLPFQSAYCSGWA